MPSLSVRPLHIGTITRQIASFCPTLGPELVDLPLICWLIEGSDKLILVDAGGGDPSAMPPELQPYQRGKEQTIEYALRKIGLSCNDVDIVVVTHLHWDHCGSLQLFPRAKIIVQAVELQSASPFPPGISRPYHLIDDVDFTVVSGDLTISDGVKVISTPGHTYGLQGVLVNAENRSIFIASDTFPLFENVESDPPILSNTFVDLEQYQKSERKISGLSAFILPGHDFKVFDEDIYF